MFFLNIIAHYFLPIIYDSFVVLTLALIFLFILRIKDPNIRILFFTLPLIKPFIIIIERIDVNKIYLQLSKSVLGFRLPDPSNIIKFDQSTKEVATFTSNTDYIIGLVILISIFTFLIIRWVSLALFYRRLAYEEKVGRKEVPDIYKIIDNFTAKTKTSSPDVSLTHKTYISPFIVGLRRFTLVLSPKLFEHLNENEKETLIQHELCHIKRKDNLIGWITLIIKDLNFFNPFAYIAYYLIRSEQEKACDQLVVKYSGKSAENIASNILNSILKLKLTLGPNSHLIPAASSAFSFTRIFSQKRLENRIHSITSTDINRIYSRIFPKILMLLLFILLLFVQIIFTFKIGNLIFVLR
ncbi:MAG: M56 family metallopeptidase [Actinobacteria bacterium]|nr:M56 family metallopeptidase [Actinomycetota bacterium]